MEVEESRSSVPHKETATDDNLDGVEETKEIAQERKCSVGDEEIAVKLSEDSDAKAISCAIDDFVAVAECNNNTVDDSDDQVGRNESLNRATFVSRTAGKKSPMWTSLPYSRTRKRRGTPSPKDLKS